MNTAATLAPTLNAAATWHTYRGTDAAKDRLRRFFNRLETRH